MGIVEKVGSNMKFILCILLLNLFNISIANLETTNSQSRSIATDAIFKLPCEACKAAIEWLKEFVGYQKNINSEFIHSVMNSLCSYIKKINTWAGNKCINNFMKKSVTMVIEKFLAKNMETAKMCGYVGHLALLAVDNSGSLASFHPINCKKGKNHNNKLIGLSDEDVIQQGIKEYMENFKILMKMN